MATTNKTFIFTSTTESWTGTDNVKAYAVYANSRLEFQAIGRSQAGSPTWVWTGTWQDLGVASGNQINSVDGSIFVEHDPNVVDVANYKIEITDGLGTFELDSYNFSTSTPYSATRTLTSRDYTGNERASTESITITITGGLDTGNNKDAYQYIYLDDISIDITNEAIPSPVTIDVPISTINPVSALVPVVSTNSTLSLSVATVTPTTHLVPVITSVFNGYFIERKVGIAGSWSPLNEVTLDTFTYLDSNNIQEGETYYYRVKLVLNGESDWSNEVEITVSGAGSVTINLPNPMINDSLILNGSITTETNKSITFEIALNNSQILNPIVSLGCSVTSGTYINYSNTLNSTLATSNVITDEIKTSNIETLNATITTSQNIIVTCELTSVICETVDSNLSTGCLVVNEVTTNSCETLLSTITTSKVVIVNSEIAISNSNTYNANIVTLNNVTIYNEISTNSVNALISTISAIKIVTVNNEVSVNSASALNITIGTTENVNIENEVDTNFITLNDIIVSTTKFVMIDGEIAISNSNTNNANILSLNNAFIANAVCISNSNALISIINTIKNVSMSSEPYVNYSDLNNSIIQAVQNNSILLELMTNSNDFLDVVMNTVQNTQITALVLESSSLLLNPNISVGQIVNIADEVRMNSNTSLNAVISIVYNNIITSEILENSSLSLEPSITAILNNTINNTLSTAYSDLLDVTLSALENITYTDTFKLTTLDNPTPFGTSNGDRFGNGVSISGNYAIVGANLEDDLSGTQSGKAYIYDIRTSELLWTLDNPNVFGTSENDYFGGVVSISGNLAIVGSGGEDDESGIDAGKSYIFNVLTGEKLLTIDNPNAFGTSESDYFSPVAISGNYAIVGAFYEDDENGINSGKAYVFNATTGELLWIFDNPNPFGTSENDNFGGRVAISETHAIIGASTEDDANGASSGKAYIYDVTTGELIWTLSNPNFFGTSLNDYFGGTVSISGNLAIVGASGEDSADGTGTGKAYIFDVSTGELLKTLNNPNNFGTVVDDTFGGRVAISGNRAMVASVYEDDSSGTQSGVVYIFNATTGDLLWTLENPNAFGTSKTDVFGMSISIDGDNIIIGTPYEDDTGGLDSGKAYIFSLRDKTINNEICENTSTSLDATISTLENTTYTDTFKITTLDNPNAFGTSADDFFGMRVEISGNYAIVGAMYEDDANGTMSGKVYIFDVTTRELLWTLDNPNPFGTSKDDYFGNRISSFENHVIIGAVYEDDAGGTTSGKAYIYDVTTGELLLTLDNPSAFGTSGNDRFGVSVSISSNYAIVGAYGEDELDGSASGKAYIFDVTTGELLKTLNNPNNFGTSNLDQFGYSVAISEDYAIAGVHNEDDTGGTESGKAYIFDVTTGELLWTLDNPNAFGTSADDFFGFSVAISGDYAIVGAYFEDDASGIDSGKAYIYDVSTGELLWTLDNPNPFGTSVNDLFGITISASGNYVIIGAHYEDDANGTESGKAYIFDVTTGGLLWTLDNPNAFGTSESDFFGVSVSVSDNQFIVGSAFEDESGSSASGKAYIFTLRDVSIGNEVMLSNIDLLTSQILISNIIDSTIQTVSSNALTLMVSAIKNVQIDTQASSVSYLTLNPTLNLKHNIMVAEEVRSSTLNSYNVSVTTIKSVNIIAELSGSSSDVLLVDLNTGCTVSNTIGVVTCEKLTPEIDVIRNIVVSDNTRVVNITANNINIGSTINFSYFDILRTNTSDILSCTISTQQFVVITDEIKVTNATTLLPIVKIDNSVYPEICTNTIQHETPDITSETFALVVPDVFLNNADGLSGVISTTSNVQIISEIATLNTTANDITIGSSTSALINCEITQLNLDALDTSINTNSIIIDNLRTVSVNANNLSIISDDQTVIVTGVRSSNINALVLSVSTVKNIIINSQISAINIDANNPLIEVAENVSVNMGVLSNTSSSLTASISTNSNALVIGLLATNSLTANNSSLIVNRSIQIDTSVKTVMVNALQANVASTGSVIVNAMNTMVSLDALNSTIATIKNVSIGQITANANSDMLDCTIITSLNSFINMDVSTVITMIHPLLLKLGSTINASSSINDTNFNECNLSLGVGIEPEIMYFTSVFLGGVYLMSNEFMIDNYIIDTSMDRNAINTINLQRSIKSKILHSIANTGINQVTVKTNKKY